MNQIQENDIKKLTMKLIIKIISKINVEEIPIESRGRWQGELKPPITISDNIKKYTSYSLSYTTENTPNYSIYIENNIDFIKFDEFISLKDIIDSIKFKSSLHFIKKPELLILYLLDHILKERRIEDLSEEVLKPYISQLIDFLNGEEPLQIYETSIIGFLSNAESIELEDNISLQKIPLERRNFFFSKFSRFESEWDRSDLLINEWYLIHKYYHKEGPINGEALSLQIDFIRFCRLFKSGNINCPYMFLRTEKWHPNPLYGGSQSEKRKISINNSDYIIAEEEIIDFKNFWNIYRKIDFNSNKYLEIIINRFDSSFSSKNYENRLIDLMIAFESMFLLSNSELSFKLALYVSNYIKNEVEDPFFTFTFMKKAYHLRSQIVHGSEIKKECKIKYNEKIYSYKITQVVTELEEILRKCIRRYITYDSKLSINELLFFIEKDILNN